MSNKNIEKRTYRSDISSDPDKSRTIKGYAALYNSETQLWDDVFEVIAPGAFRNAISVSDIKLLKNHDANIVLGRTKAGNLRVWDDEVGLPFEGDLPETTAGNDSLIEVRSKLIDQCSFAFTIKRYEIEKRDRNGNKEILYRILEVDQIYDVSIVTYPAYKNTSVSANENSSVSEWSKRTIQEAIDEYKKREIESEQSEPDKPTQQNDNILKLVEASIIY